MKKVITVSRNGTMRFIYDDNLRRLLDQGEAMVCRASHVEPGDPMKKQNPLKWYADLLPAGGEVLGPFTTRQQALDAEVEWLTRRLLASV